MNVLSDVCKVVKAKIIGWSDVGELGAQGMNGPLGGGQVWWWRGP